MTLDDGFWVPRNIPRFWMEFCMSSLCTVATFLGKYALGMPQLYVCVCVQWCHDSPKSIDSAIKAAHAHIITYQFNLISELLDFAANAPTVEVQPCRFVPVRHVHFITTPNPELLNQQNQRTCWHPQGIPKIDGMHRAERNMGWMERLNGCQGTLVIKQHETDCRRGISGNLNIHMPEQPLSLTEFRYKWLGPASSLKAWSMKFCKSLRGSPGSGFGTRKKSCFVMKHAWQRFVALHHADKRNHSSGKIGWIWLNDGLGKTWSYTMCKFSHRCWPVALCHFQSPLYWVTMARTFCSFPSRSTSTPW